MLGVKQSAEIDDGYICNDHVIHLLVTGAVEKSAHLHSALKKAIGLASKVHLSPLYDDKLEEKCEQMNVNYKKLTTPVKTRWNSPFFCLKSVLEMSKPFKSFSETNDQFEELCSSLKEFQPMREAISILESFYKLSIKLSADKEITIAEVIPGIFQAK